MNRSSSLGDEANAQFHSQGSGRGLLVSAIDALSRQLTATDGFTAQDLTDHKTIPIYVITVSLVMSDLPTYYIRKIQN